MGEQDFNEYIPLRDIVFKTLRERIITGELKPGDRLMEVKLANEMGVSRTPVREAIRKLTLEGLVILNDRRGAVVAGINEKDLMEILEIRKALEQLSVKLACDNGTAADAAELRRINQEIKDAVDAEEVKEITELDVAFHDKINNMGGNDHLVKMLHQLKAHLYRYRLEFIKDMKNRMAIVNEHEKIIEAIEEKNTRLAVKEIIKHIESLEKFILGTISGGGLKNE